MVGATTPFFGHGCANHDIGAGREDAHATAGAVVTAETVAGLRRLWSITPTATFFCRRWRQRPQARGGSARDRPRDDQAPALVSGGEVVPFLRDTFFAGERHNLGEQTRAG